MMAAARYRQPAFLAALLLGLCALLLPGWLLAQSQAAIPALDSPVVDTTGTLDAATRAQLEAQARQLEAGKGSQLQILIVPSTAPEDIARYAQRAFDAWKLGRPGVDDGVLLVVAKDDRRVRIHTGYGLEGAIPDALARRIIQEYMVPRFRQQDYAGGILEASAQLVRLIEGEPLPEPVAAHASGGVLGWLLLLGSMAATVGTVVAIIGVLVWLLSRHPGRYVSSRHSGGWQGSYPRSSGGGWSGGSSGGSSRSSLPGIRGWSGGGGRSGGGGASGGW